MIFLVWALTISPKPGTPEHIIIAEQPNFTNGGAQLPPGCCILESRSEHMCLAVVTCFMCVIPPGNKHLCVNGMFLHELSHVKASRLPFVCCVQADTNSNIMSALQFLRDANNRLVTDYAGKIIMVRRDIQIKKDGCAGFLPPEELQWLIFCPHI